MQSKNIYVDTNIILDICDDKRVCFRQSLDRVAFYQKSGCELFINSDSYANLFYILKSQSKYDLSYCLDKLKLIQTIFTLVSIENEDVNQAIKMCEDNSIASSDYEDIMQYICAKKVNAKVILTNDKKFVDLDIELERT